MIGVQATVQVFLNLLTWALLSVPFLVFLDAVRYVTKCTVFKTKLSEVAVYLLFLISLVTSAISSFDPGKPSQRSPFRTPRA